MNHAMLRAASACAISAVLFLAGCSQSRPPEKTYPAGSPVEVGNLTYSIGNTEWHNSLAGERGPRVPAGRFLVLTVSVTNKASDAVTMPLLSVVDSSGAQHLELNNGEGLGNWLGLFRDIAANGSDGGEIVFDVPAGKGPYKLRVSSGGDVEKEVTALIEIGDEKSSPSGAPIESKPAQ